MNKLLIVGLAVALVGCNATESMLGGGQKAAPPPPAQAAASSTATNDMKNVQQRLADAGFYHGALDGVNGPATQDALRGYQRAHSLDATGKMDTATSAVMYPDTH